MQFFQVPDCISGEDNKNVQQGVKNPFQQGVL